MGLAPNLYVGHFERECVLSHNVNPIFISGTNILMKSYMVWYSKLITFLILVVNILNWLWWVSGIQICIGRVFILLCQRKNFLLVKLSEFVGYVLWMKCIKFDVRIWFRGFKKEVMQKKIGLKRFANIDQKECLNSFKNLNK